MNIFARFIQTDRPNMKARIIAMLSDREWHGPADLLACGTSYTQCVNKLRRERGYIIEDRWTHERGGTKEYRLVATPDEVTNHQDYDKKTSRS